MGCWDVLVRSVWFGPTPETNLPRSVSSPELGGLFCTDVLAEAQAASKERGMRRALASFKSDLSDKMNEFPLPGICLRTQFVGGGLFSSSGRQAAHARDTEAAGGWPTPTSKHIAVNSLFPY